MNDLDMTEDTFQKFRDYMMAGHQIRGRHGFRIPALVLDQWHQNGFAVLRTNTLARHFGVQRKTMWQTIKGAVDAGFIKEIGRTEEGKAMYVPCLERGEEWRAAREGQS
ncbi:hypothetical protein J2046_006781 [Rhizobium petrolearium]|uniref:hypothetical protein n=1 Tax=Neorhizobium petrolearium TaxID=515361 RepID=UPI001AE80BF4|nr:hypothetical protein [Neorhizobium petrolearium]MBP1848485.1 hypothetical protein [Neorhizobium petrolearium]